MNLLADPITLWLVAARLSGLVVSMPGLPQYTVPRTVRAALVVWLTLALVGVVPAARGIPLSPLPIAAMVAGEFVLGLGYGFVLRMVFAAVEMGASVIDSEMGFMAASQFNPFLGYSSGVFVSFWLFIALAYFWTLDLFPVVFAGLHESFRLIPPGAVRGFAGNTDEFLRASAGIFTGGLVFAAPILSLTFFATVGIGLLSKAVQGISLFAENFSLRIIIGGVGMLALLPLMLALLRAQLARLLPAATRYFETLVLPT